VIDWLKGLRTNAFNVPEMEKFVCCDVFEPFKIFVHITSGQRDRGAISVFHSTAARRLWKMINKGVSLKWAVVHPCSFGCDDLFNRGNNFVEDSGGIAIVHYNPVIAASGSEITLVEVGKFSR